MDDHFFSSVNKANYIDVVVFVAVAEDVGNGLALFLEVDHVRFGVRVLCNFGRQLTLRWSV